MNVRAALSDARAQLLAVGVSSPELDAALLLAETLGVRRERLALDPDRELTPTESSDFLRLLGERAKRVPMAQILGRAEFWSLEFEVTADTLSPRPETEMLVEEAVKALAGVERPVVVDIGTGTGCIAVAIAKEVPTATVHAVDISAAALAVARRNVRRHGVEGRVRLHLGEMFAPLAGVLAPGSVDVVVSNPPYVRRDEEFDPEILFEPAMALFVDDVPGVYGRIADAAAAFARSGGVLVMELPGPGSEAVIQLLRRRTSWAARDVCADGAGLARMFSATRVVAEGTSS